MSIAALGQDFAAHWLVYSSMPVIAAVIGYITKRVAIEMMYEPLEFVGVKGTLIGWQGILPRNARRMATIAMDLLMNNLIHPKEIFARLDPNRIVEELEGPLLIAVDDITRDILEQYQPALWESLPGQVQRMLLSRVRAQAPRLVRSLMADVAGDIESVIDIRDMAITACVRDKGLLNRLIKEIATPEMRFIARSGIYFGFTIGLIQMITWALTKEPLIMPLFGLCVGWFTDWLALKLIFLPREPKRIFGLTFQGKFQRRRHQVAGDYGALIAKEVLTVHNVLEAALTGPRSDRLFAMIEHQVQTTIDSQMNLAKPLVVMGVGTQRFRQMKEAAARKAMQRVPETVRYIEGYATDTLDVANTIVTGMRSLSSLEYEQLLRPAFKQDEWKLISVGAIIGFLVGELQILLVLHG
ncbi:MAG: DUF445 domain-containing protein [Sciscionella sp.]